MVILVAIYKSELLNTPPLIDADDKALLTALELGSELHRALFLSPRPWVRGFLLRNQFERISPIRTAPNSISSCEVHIVQRGDVWPLIDMLRSRCPAPRNGDFCTWKAGAG